MGIVNKFVNLLKGILIVLKCLWLNVGLLFNFNLMLFLLRLGKEFIFRNFCILLKDILVLVNKWSVFFMEIEIENFIIFKVDISVKIWKVVRWLLVRSSVVMEMNLVIGVLVKYKELKFERMVFF